MSHCRAILATVALIAACSAEAPPPDPTVSDAWIREAPPGAGMTAGYLTVHNPRGEEIRITGVDSGDFGAVELHATVSEQGVARMRREESVAVPPGGTVVFEPGGRHLMMFDPARPLADGDTVVLTVRLADGTLINADAAVVRGSHVHHH